MPERTFRSASRNPRAARSRCVEFEPKRPDFRRSLRAPRMHHGAGMRRLLPWLLVSSVGCQPTCTPGSPGVPGPSRLSVAGTLSASDFEVSAPGSDVVAVADDGSFAPPAAVSAGLLVATPRAGTAADANAFAMYLAPTTGRAVLTGPPYRVAEDVAPALDAKTTVLALLLLNPSIAHPSEDGTRQALAFFATKLDAGWPTLEAAASLWDSELAAGRSPSESEAFVDALTSLVAEVGDELRIVVAPADAPQPLEPYVPMNSAGVVVSSVGLGASASGSQRVKPATRTGTALDHVYIVRRIPPNPLLPYTFDPAFSPLSVLTTFDAPVLEKGVVPASSYASYLDVVGNTLRRVSGFLASPVAPAEGVALAGDQVAYEIRFFSGGFGRAHQVEDDAFQREHFKAEGEAALMQNLAVGVVEAIKLIPGSEAATDTGGTELIEEAILTLGQGVASLVAVKRPSDITGEDLYAIAYEAAKSVVDKAVEKATEGAQEAAWKRFVQFIGRGGSVAAKTVIGIPGKLATGGALTNRVVRLAAPESLMEVWTVAVDTREVATIDAPYVFESVGAHTTLRATCTVHASGRQLFTIPQLDARQHSFTAMRGAPAEVSLSCDTGSAVAEPMSWTEPNEPGTLLTTITSLSMRFSGGGGFDECAGEVEDLDGGRRTTVTFPDDLSCSSVSLRGELVAFGTLDFRDENGASTRVDTGELFAYPFVTALLTGR